jgi:hypothetical protein
MKKCEGGGGVGVGGWRELGGGRGGAALAGDFIAN